MLISIGYHLQNLLTQQRARTIYLQQQLGVSGFDAYGGQQAGVPDDMQRLQMENVGGLHFKMQHK